MNDSERISHLEDVVKHLVLARQDEGRLADHFDKTMSLEELYVKDQEHKSAFKKFLNWMAG